MVWNLILYRMVLPQMEKWRKISMKVMKENGGDWIQEGIHVLPQML